MDDDKNERLFKRTRKFTIDVFKLCEKLGYKHLNRPIINQLLRSSSSVGANHRACKRAKSRKDFLYKITIVEEEADESAYWLDILLELNPDVSEIKKLHLEACELTAIFTTIGKNTKLNMQL